MKVKNRQIYLNECGKYAIMNLLDLDNIKVKDLDIKLSKNGISIDSMVKCLKNYYLKVDVINFDIDELKKVKHFKPFIILAKDDNVSHYLVCYKRDNKYLYILDSLKKRSYKVKYEDFKKLTIIAFILVDQKKKIDMKGFLIKNTIIIILLSFIESLFLLSTTILLQQIIDNGFNDAVLYILVQILLLLITTIKMKSFLNIFKRIDNDLVLNTIRFIYKLDKNYIEEHDIDEIYYRANDTYTLKGMILSFIFEVTSNIILAILTILLMFYYSYILALIILAILTFIVLISIYIFNKSRVLVEKRRTSEYNFMSYYRDSFKNLDKTYDGNDEEMNESIKRLHNFQIDDYNYEKLQMNKNLLLLYFQSILISLVIVFYFLGLNSIISLGSLVAIINMITLVLQPTLNLCSNLSEFSNIRLIISRIKDIIYHVK